MNIKYKRKESNTVGNYPDQILLLLVLLLVSLGLIMVYSSSSISSLDRFHDSMFYVKRQASRLSIALVLMFFFTFFDYRKLKPLNWFVLGLGYLLLCLIFIPGIGVRAGGASRWIDIGIRLQPSEFFKLSLLVFAASKLSQIDEVQKKFQTCVLPVIIATSLGFLLIQGSDLSTSLIIIILGFSLIFSVYLNWWLLSSIFLSSGALISYIILVTPFRLKRVVAFLNPWENQLESAYQIIQSLVSLGSGGLFGLGLGQSRQKFLFLPEEHTDFIFAILGEEFGFVGCIFILLVFFAFCWRGLKIVQNSKDLFGKLLALGIVVYLGMQTVINICVVTGLLPPTGMPLPFLSYGGSSMIANLIAIGILLNISRGLDA
ncbi:MAG: putative lipid II flippase FtsW [Candidatus Cloacimonadota bacterium]|nr:MAG: putative lipid II flippase FtsW [Candidatus Cloacimonadota bacterium]